MNSREELKQCKIDFITDACRPLLSSVDWADNSVDCWIECVNDDAETVRIIPDKTGWQDGRRELHVMNTASGKNCKLFFEYRTDCGFERAVPHDITMHDGEAKDAMLKIPYPVLLWAVSRAR